MLETINHVILLISLSSFFTVSSVHPSCPAGCTCRPDPSFREVPAAIRMTCSGRPADIRRTQENILDYAEGQVTHLDLSGIELVAIRKDFNFFNFPHVRHLNLSHNRLKSIERGAIGRLKFLKTLDLSHNHLKFLDHGFFSDDDDQKEEDNDGDNHGDNHEDNEEEPKDYDQARSEDYDATEMTRGFQSLKKSLTELDLSHNQLSSIDGVFDELESLAKLNLDDNRLENISSITFRSLPNLRWLVLNSNRLRKINSDAFSGAGRLTNLMMKNNTDLQQLDRLNLKSCSYLNYLDISECGLISTPKLLPDSLRYLQLRRNRLTKIDLDSFKECSGLNILLLDGNGIAIIEDDSFENMINLQQLWLNENLLSTVPRHLPNSLQRLLLDSNRLSSFPSDVFKSIEINPPSLSILSLSGNKISEIETETFNKLTRLSSLDLSDNHIQSLPHKAFSKSLSSLNLNKNPLRHFHDGCLEGLNSLRNLHLSFVDTPLENLAVSRAILKPLRANLKTLEIDHSPSLARRFISEPFFGEDNFTVSSMTSLDEISITGTDFVTVTKEEINHFIPSNLKSLRFISTRWHCDKSMVWLQEWMNGQPSFLQTANSNLCYTPRFLHGKPLISLAARDFVAITTTLTPPSSRPMKSPSRSTQTPPKSRSSTPSSARSSSKSSKKLHTTPHDAWKDDERVETNATGNYTPFEKTMEMFNEESLVIHVSDFIRRTKIEEKIPDGAVAAPDDDDDDDGGGGGGGGNDGETKKDEVIDKSANVGTRETETSLDENESHETETPKKPSERVDQLEEYFKQYFPSNEVDSTRRTHSTNRTNRTHHHHNNDNNLMRNSFDADVTERNGFIVTIAIIIIVITAIIAACIIFLIILTCRKKRKSPKETVTSISKDSLAESNKTIIKYKNKDGTLYFSTSSMTGMDTESTDVNSSVSTRPSIADRKFNEQATKYRNSPILSEAKSGGLFTANGSCNNNSNNCNNNIHNNSNKTLSYRWEDT